MVLDEAPSLRGGLRPALGMTWHHCLTTRLYLTLLNSANSAVTGSDAVSQQVDSSPHPDWLQRHLRVTKCPWLPQVGLKYRITAAGFVSV